MPTFTPQQLKKALVDAGFIIFRTLADEVMLAERVRENLIMDSGVRLKATPALEVRVVLRAQRGEFPGEDEAHLFARVRALATPALESGFTELGQVTSHVTDPGDSTRTLDTFYEVTLGKEVAGLEAALEVVRFAFALDRVARSASTA
jgi:hypothetical protein